MPKNISDVTITDSNVPFTIMMCSSSNYTMYNETEFNTLEEAYSALYSVIGEDVFTIYNIPPNDISPTAHDFVSQLEYFIPSIPKAYPNIFSYWENSSSAPNIFIHIPTLNNLILYRGVGKSRYEFILGRMSPTGQITFSSNKLFMPGLQWPSVSGYRIRTASFLVIDYTNPSDLTTYGKIGWAGIARTDRTATRLGATYCKTFSEFEIDRLLKYFFGDNVPPPDGSIIQPPNPYEPGSPSGPTDPDLPPGTFDDNSDPIPDSPLPTISAANTGFTRIYNPTLSQVQALAQYLWTTPDLIQTIWNHIKQFFENPMDAIIGFNLVPVPIPDGGTENFKLMFIDTGIAMTAAANQFVDLDCGTVEVKRYYGSALDQSPYTKVSCFLPFIGTVQLNTDEVMGTTLQVKYRVDICSGSCVAKIFIDGNCLYQYSGHCAINIPISSSDFSSYVSAAINVAKLAIGAATGGAAGAAMAATQVANGEQQTNNVVNWQSQYGVGSSSNLPAPIGISQSPGGPGPETEQTSTSASFAGLTPANISNTVGEIMNAKPHVEHSGSFSGNTGYLGVRRPFIIIERPNMCMPANYQALNGFPAMITMELGTCKGFTRVQQVQLTGMTATNPEQAEILELLKSGVLL